MDTNAKEQAALFAKIARVASKIGTLEKGGENTHFKYKFVEDGLVSETVRVLLAAENVAFFASMDDVSIPAAGHVICSFTYTFADGDTGAIWSSRWFGEAKDNQDKAINKAATASLKYYLLKTFMIPTGKKTDDPDNDTRLNKGNAQPKTAPKPGNPPQNTPLISSEGFSVETGRNFMGWAKRAFNFDEDTVRKTLDHAAGRELASLTMWPYSTLDAAAALVAADQEYSGDHIRGYLESVKKGGVKLLSMSGKPFTAPELEHLLSKAMELNEVKE